MKRRIFTTLAGLLALISIAATLIVKISEFPAVTTPSDTDLFLLASGSTNKNVTFANLRNALGGSSTNVVNNLYSTNVYSTTNYYTVGKGGKLIVTNGITPLDVTASSLLRVDSNQKIAATTVGTGLSFDGTTLSASSSGGGSALYVNGTSVTNANFKDGAFIVIDTVATTNLSVRPLATVTTLTWSGTNLVGMDLAASKVFKITLTNSAFFATSTFANLPTTSQYAEWVLMVQEDSTGGYFLNFTNSTIAWAEGVQPVKTTNANAIDYYYFHTDLSTNSTLVGNMNQNVHR